MRAFQPSFLDVQLAPYGQFNRSPHGSELPFDFGKINDGSGTKFIGSSRDAQDATVRDRLMSEMISAWVNFTKISNPNGGTLLEWPFFNLDTRPIMRFGVITRSENAPYQAEDRAISEFMQTFNIFDMLK